jgi:hypothetical protein
VIVEAPITEDTDRVYVTEIAHVAVEQSDTEDTDVVYVTETAHQIVEQDKDYVAQSVASGPEINSAETARTGNNWRFF